MLTFVIKLDRSPIHIWAAHWHTGQTTVQTHGHSLAIKIKPIYPSYGDWMPSAPQTCSLFMFCLGHPGRFTHWWKCLDFRSFSGASVPKLTCVMHGIQQLFFYLWLDVILDETDSGLPALQLMFIKPNDGEVHGIPNI